MTPNISTEIPLYGQSPEHLDLFSTTQKVVLFCSYRAPFFAYEISGKTWGVTQGCCNHWDCPRCGQQRARVEYGRIVEGCRQLESEHNLYFITLTCKGKSLKLADAMKGYLQWTNRLFSTLRADAKKRGVHWSYVQVTEQQGRGHPHSHVLTTYYPNDLVTGWKHSFSSDDTGLRVMTRKPVLRSEYLGAKAVSAGLGEQYDISKVDKVEGASRYVAKYLFHPDMFKAKYPAGWKRIRYSQNFPVLPKREKNAMVLLSREDWMLLAQKALTVRCADAVSESETRYQLRNADCFITARRDEVIAGL